MNHLQVYGFPRSGNHYIMELIGENFYAGADLKGEDGEVGHWADRQLVKGAKYGKLAGHHGPPDKFDPATAVYVFRDGRAVAASLYKSPHFMHPQWRGLTFSEFIRKPLDWSWSPGGLRHPERPRQTVVEHWKEHLSLWGSLSYWHVFKECYEAAVLDPAGTLDGIAMRFGFTPRLDYRVAGQDNLVGWFPSGGLLTGWRDLWTDDDLEYFWSVVPRDFFGVFDYDRDRTGIISPG
jgi:hypothetical protein